LLNASFEECDRILQGIAAYQSELCHWDVFIESSEDESTVLNILGEHRWDGVICRSTQQKIVDRCRSLNLPLVDLNDCETFRGVPKIRNDNEAIGHLAAEELHGRGYRNLYFCGYHGQVWSAERAESFLEASRLLGVSVGIYLTDHGTGLTPAENAEMVDQLAHWLKSVTLPAGIFAAHDLRGRQIIQAAARAGLHVPDEIAIIGVNNEEIRSRLCQPPLSSIQIDSLRMGRTAAELLDRLLQGTPVSPIEIKVEPVGVITRGSTDGLSIPDTGIAAALALIRKEACNGITIREVLKRTSISRSHLEQGFRRYINRSPRAEIRRIQILVIKKLLKETTFPLKEIAEQTGFEHIEYLSVFFKRAVGLTPGAFRRQHQTPSSAALV
jgi:LacI family transcriptional regulator